MNLFDIVLFYLKKKSVLVFLFVLFIIVCFKSSPPTTPSSGSKVKVGLEKTAVHVLYESIDDYISEKSDKIPSAQGTIYEECMVTEFFGKKRGSTTEGEAPAVHLVTLCYFVMQHYVAHSVRVKETDVTLVTNVHVRHLDDLSKVAMGWTGTISATVLVDDAVYVKSPVGTRGDYEFKINEEYGSRMKEIEEWLKSLEESPLKEVKTLRERLSLHLVFPSRKDYAFMYPVNLMRNVAAMFSKSDYLLIMNSDLVPSKGFFSDLTTLPLYANLPKLLDQRHVFCIPSFQFCNHSVANYDLLTIPETKKDLVDLLSKAGDPKDDHKIESGDSDGSSVIHKKDYPHACPLRKHKINPHSQYAFNIKDQWITATKPYYLDYAVKFETAIIISRKHCPVFDEYFLDRQGLDLQMHVAILDLGKFKFVADPMHFLFQSRESSDNNMQKQTKKSKEPTFEKDYYVPSLKNMYVAKMHSLVTKKLELSKLCESKTVKGVSGEQSIPASVLEFCTHVPVDNSTLQWEA